LSKVCLLTPFRGTSYRSAIFYTSPEQKHVAEDTIADVDA
jgi:peptide-methionine (S)-S-oxide reductase